MSVLKGTFVLSSNYRYLLQYGMKLNKSSPGGKIESPHLEILKESEYGGTVGWTFSVGSRAIISNQLL